MSLPAKRRKGRFTVSERTRAIAGAKLRRAQHEALAQEKYEDRGETVAVDNKRGVAKRLREMALAQGVEGDVSMTRAEAEKFMALTHDEKNMLTLIATGYPVRNATAILSVLKLKLDKTIPPAVQENQGQSNITVVVNTLPETQSEYALGPNGSSTSPDAPRN